MSGGFWAQFSREKTLKDRIAISLDAFEGRVAMKSHMKSHMKSDGVGSKMTALLLVGTDNALIEATAQILTTGDHQLFFARSLADALGTVGDLRPLVVLVERSAIDEIRMTLRVPLAQGGAFVVFHGEDATAAPLPHRVQRAIIAELELPLERHRLLALIRYVENRAQTVGWDSIDDGAEIQAT